VMVVAPTVAIVARMASALFICTSLDCREKTTLALSDGFRPRPGGSGELASG
jgi:hypothetical protein